MLVGCADEAARRRAVELKAEEWFLLPATAEEISARIWSAVARGAGLGAAVAERVDRVEYEQMLHDSLTGLPTLPVAIERSRQLFKERGELVVLYFNFVRYSKIEEIYGWEKLDSVLETTASAVRDFLDDDELGASRVMVSFTNDDDFIFFHVPASGVAAATESEITEMVTRLQRHVGGQIEEAHGEDIAALFDIYVGRAHLYYNPKIRLERLIYRGIREAANASRSVEQRERARRVSDLRTSLRDRSVYIDYHPIVVAATREIFGYEALARGQLRTLRSPEVMFDVAAEADLIWELSRLCRARALEGMNTRLSPGQLLFINVDPHDFADPAFNETGSRRPIARRHRDHRAHGDQGLPEVPRAVEGVPKSGLPLRGRRRGQRLRRTRIDRQSRARLHQARHLVDQRASTRTSSSRTSSRRWSASPTTTTRW